MDITTGEEEEGRRKGGEEEGRRRGGWERKRRRGGGEEGRGGGGEDGKERGERRGPVERRINGLLCAGGYILTCIFVLVKDVLHTTEGIVL